ncbi:transposase [Bythopirellula polymerisocia]|uniref:Transposase IS200-like domain-containing protein n=1 Tax=Bythopirellula polymerisocia TaxID=2528003 RepID=A0A5C6CHA4_9BACT|nr:transposase [Bythopirellula polymerisocia]TWU23738.1 hypothetical protein Pla144_39130 [Bythopirellula polymerisocia]
MSHFKKLRKSSATKTEVFRGEHRYEHWYLDNQVYFITARCRERYPAFAGDDAKHIFWERVNHYTTKYEFFPWVTSLLDNHYHTLGYLRTGENLGPLIQHLHGSVAQLVNDLLPERRLPFWRSAGNRDYFDDCLRDEKQCRLAFRYTLTQGERQGVVRDYRDYPHTRVQIELERGLKRAMELKAFIEGVPYRRYQTGR